MQVTDMRTQKEIATYRGHNRDVICAAWHPYHEELFASGGYDGSLLYWLVSSPEPQVRQHTLTLFCCLIFDSTLSLRQGLSGHISNVSSLLTLLVEAMTAPCYTGFSLVLNLR